MHVTLFKPGPIPVPPPLYGGTQRLMNWLSKGLQALGHTVTVVAHPDSQVSGVELIPSADPGASQDIVPDSTDVIHFFDLENPSARKPFLVTINGNGNGPRRFHPNTVFVSAKHAANHGSCNFVHNGLDPDDYLFSEKREDFAIFLAKARWKVKNLEGAISVARRAGIELRVLGSRNWPLNLQRVVPPALRGGIRYYGMLGGHEKLELLSRARCLILPVRWQEPFGLAITEALASGAYVCGTPYGSQPEIVTERVGALSTRATDLAEAVRNPNRFRPSECRARVCNGGFTHLDMARKYVSFYEIVLARGSLLNAGEPAPATIQSFNPKKLLPWDD